MGRKSGAASVVSRIGSLAAPRAGVFGAMDTRGIGLAIVALGGGRRLPRDKVDPRVGITRLLPLGTAVKAGEALLRVHAASAAAADAALLTLRDAVQIHDGPALPNPSVLRSVVGRPGRAG